MFAVAAALLLSQMQLPHPTVATTAADNAPADNTIIAAIFSVVTTSATVDHTYTAAIPNMCINATTGNSATDVILATAAITA